MLVPITIRHARTDHWDAAIISWSSELHPVWQHFHLTARFVHLFWKSEKYLRMFHESQSVRASVSAEPVPPFIHYASIKLICLCAMYFICFCISENNLVSKWRHSMKVSLLEHARKPKDLHQSMSTHIHQPIPFDSTTSTTPKSLCKSSASSISSLIRSASFSIVSKTACLPSIQLSPDTSILKLSLKFQRFLWFWAYFNYLWAFWVESVRPSWDFEILENQTTERKFHEVDIDLSAENQKFWKLFTQATDHDESKWFECTRGSRTSLKSLITHALSCAEISPCFVDSPKSSNSIQTEKDMPIDYALPRGTATRDSELLVTEIQSTRTPINWEMRSKPGR